MAGADDGSGPRRLKGRGAGPVEDLLHDYVGNPVVQVVLLFLVPFVLEEAAMVGAAAVSASGELPPLVALAAVYAGVVGSDWVVYGAGYLGGRVQWLRRKVGERNIAAGERLLHRGLIPALLVARVVPWLQPPIFLACGFLRIPFPAFAAINAVFGLVYTSVLFWALYAFDALLFDYLEAWGWVVVVAVLAVILVTVRLLGQRSGRMDPPEGGGD